MVSYQNIAEMPAPDIAIVGGGVVGLWTAYYAAQSGAEIVLIDQNTLGSGASNGLLGALMPHQPINWNEKKQFQFDGLTTLPEEIAKLEKLTGITTGYFRCGRIMPIAHPEKRRQSASWVKGAKDNWSGAYDWRVEDKNPADNWLGNIGPNGYNIDTLSARVNPRALVKALINSLAEHDNVAVLENTLIAELSDKGALTTTDAETIKPNKTIITAGHGSFPLLENITGRTLGTGVKGQAALLRPASAINISAPILYDNGTYVIAHEDGLVAVGSTSEREYSDPSQTDQALDVVIEKATKICPALENAKIIERWAGVRPRATGRDPIIGALPEHNDIIVATGGFKITLAIAHLMARCALSAAAGNSMAIPSPFLVDAHL
jgi:glycine oxidase